MTAQQPRATMRAWTLAAQIMKRFGCTFAEAVVLAQEQITKEGQKPSWEPDPVKD